MHPAISERGVSTGSNNSTQHQIKPVDNFWTDDNAGKVQDAVDRVFGPAGATLRDLEFSFTIADPTCDSADECPIIGCSKGFCELTGFDMEEIVGRNCRFLIDRTPAHLIDVDMRKCTKDFCNAVKCNVDYKRPPHLEQPWMPQGRPGDELICAQVNSRKDGTIFHNLFFLKKFSISVDLGQEKSYIVALQSELPDGVNDLGRVADNIEALDSNLKKVTSVLASMFFTRVSMTRQLQQTSSAVVTQQEPWRLMEEEAAASDRLQPWEEGKFGFVRQLADASRNKGVVVLMQDSQTEELYAAKKMPNSWVQSCHEEFIRVHPTEAELPWIDIGCARFLNSVNYKYACELKGVYRSDDYTYVLSSYARGGDIFDLAQQGISPGPDREAQLAPLVLEICVAMQQLHGMHIVHRDLSLENIVQTAGEDGRPIIKLIDYGMASSERYFKNSVRGKPSYQSPEVHKREEEYDAFLTDVFAVGVVVFAILLKDYPWLSTKPGHDKVFQFVQANGLRSYLNKKRFSQSREHYAKCMSESLIKLLEGMLACEPGSRLTFGEQQWTNRRSVWDEPWIQEEEAAITKTSSCKDAEAVAPRPSTIKSL